MKITRLIISLIFVVLLFVSCWDEKKQNGNNVAAENKLSRTQVTSIINYDSLLNIILLLENAIMRNPSDTSHISSLLRVAYDSHSELFYCVGTGIINSDMPTATQQQAMRMAAQKTALRWAVYMKNWMDGNILPLTTEARGSLANQGTLLSETSIGDTLFLLVSISPHDVTILQGN